MLLELVQPDVGVLVRVKALTVTLQADGESRGQLLGQVCLPCWVNRVGREELKIQQILEAGVKIPPDLVTFTASQYNSINPQNAGASLTSKQALAAN